MSEQEKKPIKANEVYVVVTANAELVTDEVFTDKSDADKICDNNFLGSYFTVLLSDHIKSLHLWFEKGVDDMFRD